MLKSQAYEQKSGVRKLAKASFGTVEVMAMSLRLAYLDNNLLERGFLYES